MTLADAEVEGDLLVKAAAWPLPPGPRVHAVSASRNRSKYCLARRRRLLRRVRSRAMAAVTASSRVWSRTGLVRKSTAPAFIAWTVIGISPWPVRKMTGSGLPLRRKLLLQIEPACPWHADVEDQAAGTVGQLRVQQLARCSETNRIETDGQHELLERSPDFLVVVNDENQRAVFFSVRRNHRNASGFHPRARLWAERRSSAVPAS